MSVFLHYRVAFSLWNIGVCSGLYRPPSAILIWSNSTEVGRLNRIIVMVAMLCWIQQYSFLYRQQLSCTTVFSSWQVKVHQISQPYVECSSNQYCARWVSMRDYVKNQNFCLLFGIAGFLWLTCWIFHSGLKKLTTCPNTACPMLDISGQDIGLFVLPSTEQSMCVTLFD